MSDYQNTANVMASLQGKVLGGAKIPHTVSYPVLRRDGDRYVIAVFVQIHSRELLQKKAMRRPSHWYTANLKTGELLSGRDCRKEDFCTAPFDRLYRKGDPERTAVAADVLQAYACLDVVRQRLIQDDILDYLLYRDYLRQIFLIIPSGQVPFYRELGKLNERGASVL